jgi:hypothetical protein
MTMFTLNRIIGLVLALCLIYELLRSFGFLPEGAPFCFRVRRGRRRLRA